MAQNTIYPQGTVEVTVPAAQSIAISNFGGGIAKIYYLIENTNRPPAWQFRQILNDDSVILGAFSVKTVVKIEAGNSKVIYDVAVSPDTGIGDADTLNGKASDTGDTADTIAARDAGGDLTANAFESTVVTGTAPLAVASITKVANLNSDLLDDLNSATASTASTIAARDAGGDLTANVLISDVAVGTAPLTVASTTKVANLNADLLDDLNTATASTASTVAARDASGNLTANVLISDVAVGTAPLTVASTTVVPNLNADRTDGYNASESSTVSTLSARDASANLTANVLISDVAVGTAPLTVTSTTVVPNLNVSGLSGLSASQFLRSDADDSATGIITLSSNSAYPLQLTGTNDSKILLSGSNNPSIQLQEGSADKGKVQWDVSGFLYLKNQEDNSIIRVKNDLDFSPDNGSNYYSIYHENNCELPNGVSGSFTTTDGKTVTVTSGVITAIV